MAVLGLFSSCLACFTRQAYGPSLIYKYWKCNETDSPTNPSHCCHVYTHTSAGFCSTSPEAKTTTSASAAATISSSCRLLPFPTTLYLLTMLLTMFLSVQFFFRSPTLTSFFLTFFPSIFSHFSLHFTTSLLWQSSRTT